MLKGEVQELGDSGEVTKAILKVKDGWGIVKFKLREEGQPFGEEGKVIEAKWTAVGRIGDRKVWINGQYGQMSLISQALSAKVRGKVGKAKKEAPPADDDEGEGEGANDGE